MKFYIKKLEELFLSLLGYNCSGLCNTITGNVLFKSNDVLQNENRDLVYNAESWTIRLLLQPSVSGVAPSLLVSGLTEDI